jgi:predicted metalloprotease with PDZ domain
LLASITAHEIFHAWNVKRLRPAEMVPYDYSRPQPTTLLWMSEGITDYYADLALVRGNVIPPEIFYRLTAGKIDEVANTDPVALEDASLSTWIDPVDGSRYIYYPKGSLVGFLLDIMIRDGSNNRASLDHVLRTLYQATFKAGRGFTDQEFWAAVEQAAGGRSFADVRERYVDGRDELPWARMLPLAGLVFVVDSARVPRMGVTTVQDSAGIRVNEVQEGSAAADAGVHAGDYLLRVGEVDVRDPTFGQQFRARYGNAAAGTPIRIVVRRGDREVELTGALRFDPVVSYNVREDSRASEKARRIREGILRGTTG